MALHDWSRMTNGHFYALHTMWLVNLSDKLNAGLLPEGFYALPEQHSEGFVSDVSTYDRQSAPERRPKVVRSGTAVARPRSARRIVAKEVAYPERRLVIRQGNGPRIVAVIELVSPANKDRTGSVGEFAGKVAEFLRTGVHALVIDILPPTASAPNGMHAAVWARVDREATDDPPPEGQPYLVAGYQAKRKPVAYFDAFGLGQLLPAGPLFLDDKKWFVEVPLEESYMETYRRLPAYLKDLLRR